MHNLASDLPQNLNRHDDLLGQNLSRNLDLSLVRSLGNDLELQSNLNQIAQNLNENLSAELSRMNDLRTDIPHDLSHEIDLSHHLNRQDQDVLNQDERRTPMVQCDPHMLDQSLGQRLEHTLGQRLEQSLGQRVEQTLAQRLDTNLGQRLEPNLGQRLVNSGMNVERLEQQEHILPMPFHIKAEQEDDGYFYDNMNPGMNDVGSLNGKFFFIHSFYCSHLF